MSASLGEMTLRARVRGHDPATPVIALAALAWAGLVGLGAFVGPVASVVLLVAPVGIWALLRSATVRLFVVVVGGLLVFGSSDGVGVQKVAYFGLLIVCAVLSGLNLFVDPPDWAAPFKVLLPVGLVYLLALVLATMSGPNVGLVTSVRQSLFYLMIPIAPIVGIDAGRSVSPILMRWAVPVLGTLAAISYSIDWTSRRGVFQAPIDKFMASSFVLSAMTWALAVVVVATSTRRANQLLWAVPLVLIPVALLLPGTRTNLVLFVAPLVMIGSRARRRVPGRFLLVLVGAMAGSLVVLLPLFASMFITDPAFLATRVRMLTSVFDSGVAADSSATLRVQQYDFAWQHTQQSPVFGLGPGYASEEILDTPLTVPMRIGFFGTGVLLVFLGLIVWAAVRSVRSINGSEYATAACGTALVVLSLVPFGTVIEDRGFGMMLALLLAGVGSAHRELRPSRALEGRPSSSTDTRPPLDPDTR